MPPWFLVLKKSLVGIGLRQNLLLVFSSIPNTMHTRVTRETRSVSQRRDRLQDCIRTSLDLELKFGKGVFTDVHSSLSNVWPKEQPSPRMSHTLGEIFAHAQLLDFKKPQQLSWAGRGWRARRSTRAQRARDPISAASAVANCG